MKMKTIKQIDSPCKFLFSVRKFFFRGGNKFAARKFLSASLFIFLTSKAKTNVKPKKLRFMSVRENWGNLLSGFGKSLSLVRFFPRFIKNRTKLVPYIASRQFQERRAWLMLATHVRKSKKSAKSTLASEFALLADGANQAKLVLIRNQVYEEADRLKAFVKKAYLPILPVSETFTKFEAPSDVSSKLAIAKLRRQFKPQKLNSNILFLKRIKLYLEQKQLSPLAKFMRVRLFRLRRSLFFSPYYRVFFKKLLTERMKYGSDR